MMTKTKRGSVKVSKKFRKSFLLYSEKAHNPQTAV